MTDPRRKRLEDTIAGHQPDRVPVSAWGHFFTRETSAAGLADAMLEFFNRYRWDYLKVHARASYHVEGWGFTYTPSTDPALGHRCTGMPVRAAEPTCLKVFPTRVEDGVVFVDMEAGYRASDADA